MNADEFVFEQEYFGNFDKNWSEGDYKNGFVGLTEETFGDGSKALIASATMSSNAIKEATKDAFATYKTLKDGGNN